MIHLIRLLILPSSLYIWSRHELAHLRLLLKGSRDTFPWERSLICDHAEFERYFLLYQEIHRSFEVAWLHIFASMAVPFRPAQI